MTSLALVLRRLIRIETALLALTEDEALSPSTRAAIADALKETE